MDEEKNQVEYQKVILETISGLSRDLETTRAAIREDTVQLLQEYRKDSHRSIMAAQVRIAEVESVLKSFRDQYQQDKVKAAEDQTAEQKDRGGRQKDLDMTLGRLQSWQHIRLAVEVVVLLTILIVILVRLLLPVAPALLPYVLPSG